MKPPFLSNLIPAVAITGMTLILGCGDESRKGVAQTPVAGANTSLSVSTNEALQVDPASVVPDVLPSTANPPQLAPATERVVQLARASVGDEVLLAFIEQSSGSYHLQVDEILYLHDVGLSAPVIAAMVQRDGDSSSTPSNATAMELAKTDGSAVRSAPVPPPTNSSPSSAGEPASVTLSSETPQTAAVDGPPAEAVTNNDFYNSLAPYGNWIQVADYGWCWQPTVAVVNPGWRPYCDSGRWLWSNSGWYWQSSYSWGWMPFHYGRWSCGSSGWFWVPGTVWGPSWVTWCNSGSFCGWAPLPPSCGFSPRIGLTFGGCGVGASFGWGLGFNCWTFVPRSCVCSFSPWSYCVPRSRVPVMVNNGTIVNNYINGSGNNVVINVGPGINQIAAASRTEIRKVTLHDATTAPGRPIQADRLDRSGGTLTVYRPNLPQQAPTPPAQILARQQEVRRNSEALVKSDVVQLARAEAVQRTTISPRSGGSLSSSARTTPSGSVSTPSVSSVAPRSEVRAPAPGQSSRSPALAGVGDRRIASVQPVSGTGSNPLPSNGRSEVRANSGGSSRPVQWTAPQNTPSAPSWYSSAQRPAPSPVYAPVQNTPPSGVPPRTETRNPVNRSTGSAPRAYNPMPPTSALPTAVPTHYLGSGFTSPQTSFAPAPRSYMPVSSAPSMHPAPMRSAPSYSPAPPRSPSVSPSSGNRSVSGRGAL